MTTEKKLIFHTAVYINLNRSLERKREMETIFRSRFRNWHRIEAVDGRDLDPEQRAPRMTLSELGCTLSHLKAIRFAFESGYEELLIMEDDMRIEFEDQWEKSVSEALSQAPEDADCIQFHCVNAEALEDMLKSEIQFQPWTIDHWSTGCYFIKRSGMEKVLKQEEEERSEYRQADIYVYQPMKTYVYTKPTFNHQIQTSYIHSNHLPMHAKALDVMKRYFSSSAPKN